jgi:hypothetical protein
MIISGVEGRAVKRRHFIRSPKRALEREDVHRVIFHAIFSEGREKTGLGLKGQDGAASLHQARKQERIEADVCTHVDDIHARPNEFPQQGRFVVAHPAEPVQTEGQKPVQRRGAHPSIPDIYLTPPQERSVIEVVNQGRNHFFLAFGAKSV